MDIDHEKQKVRVEVWDRLERAGATGSHGAHGRIPNFIGAELTATRLAGISAWRQAEVVKSNPDKAQLPVRVQALDEGKLLYMAVPQLADVRPFYLLEAVKLAAPPAEVATGSGAAAHAGKVGTDEMQAIDLVVCGSVAVNRDGVRVGKGAGYSDLEVALLTEAGLIGPSTVLVTTVHQLQVLDRPLPESPHDFSVDLIVTPEEVIWCAPPRRPRGIYWDVLSEQKIGAIPALSLNAGRPR
ncbi:5-formyltetrahydrofolate cyclo-ligase [Plantactinospora sp. CA-294935]|uniref:5-formyltetrahydrofolate cyclo-ligase n=1 Tax=Plantactinospora sp. CA-294935 TaxID=3240012 RepID=UPI003D921762